MIYDYDIKFKNILTSFKYDDFNLFLRQSKSIVENLIIKNNNYFDNNIIINDISINNNYYQENRLNIENFCLYLYYNNRNLLWIY